VSGGTLEKNLVTRGYQRLPGVTDNVNAGGDVPAVVEIEVVLKMELSGIKDWG